MPGLIGYGDGVGIPAGVRSTISTTYDIYDQGGLLVGWIKQLERTDARPTTLVRHLSSFDAGRIIEQVPAPETVTLRGTGFALYNKIDTTGKIPHYSLASRISQGVGLEQGGVYLFKSLNSQRIPFNIRMVETQPSTGATAITYYIACMLTGYTKPVNIGTVSIDETVAIQVGQVDELPFAASAGGTIIGA